MDESARRGRAWAEGVLGRGNSASKDPGGVKTCCVPQASMDQCGWGLGHEKGVEREKVAR